MLRHQMPRHVQRVAEEALVLVPQVLARLADVVGVVPANDEADLLRRASRDAGLRAEQSVAPSQRIGEVIARLLGNVPQERDLALVPVQELRLRRPDPLPFGLEEAVLEHLGQKLRTLLRRRRSRVKPLGEGSQGPLGGA